MRAAFKLLCALTLTLLWTVMPALADVPTEMSVQGRLTNGAGTPVPAGLKNFTFKIFDQQVGGVEIWPAGPGELQTLTTDANGLWNAGVGEIIPLTETVFQNPVRWLEVTVNDGVNPVETLPRIELRTHPYTYRAATSEQADSLGGSSLADLVGRFVDEPGDTMSGALRIDAASGPGVADLEIENINNAYPSTWATSVGVWGAQVDANGDASTFNVGLASEAQGDNTDNYAVYGYATGANSNNYGVYAFAGGGLSNYAGMFIGDVVVSSVSGDQSVQLPGDAISNTEILDEPGIASENTTAFTVPATSTMTDVETVTITTTSTGWIHVQASAYGWVGGAIGSDAYCFVQVDETAGGTFTAPYVRAFGQYAKPGADNEFYPIYCDRMYFKTPGTYTFRLEAARASVSGTGSVHVGNPILTAIFYSTSYGAVSTVMASSDAEGFTNLKPVPQNPAGADGLRESQSQGLSYSVDLRELEIKAARAEAEARNAKRELVEAQAKALLRPSQPPSAVGEERNR